MKLIKQYKGMRKVRNTNDILNDKEPIRILQFTTKLAAGGVQTFLMNYSDHMDNSKVVFDYVVQTESVCEYDQRVEKMGGIIYRVTSMEKSVLGYMRDVYKVLKQHPEYKIVHAHLNYRNILPLLVAKIVGVPVRITHSHNNYKASNFIKRIQRKLFRILLPLVATDYWACSNGAGEWLYGKRNVKNRKVKIIPNAIDISQYSYSKKIREEMRQKLNLTDKNVWLHVGMFGRAKNHGFLLKLFRDYLKKDNSAVLLLCGEGKEEEYIRHKIEELALKNYVMMLGLVGDVYKYMMAADVLVFPSLYEGLPLVIVESEATGLSCVVSSAIPEEIICNQNVRRCKGWESEIWLKEIDSVLNTNLNRINQLSNIKKLGYDLVEASMKLQSYYLELYVERDV